MKLALMIAAAAALAAPTVAVAAPVELTSTVFVEKRAVDAAGNEVLSLLPAERVVPGDKLRFVIRYKNAGGASAADFVITNPVPASVAYIGSEGSVAPVVSVDGGAIFGALPTLVVKASDGSGRPARADDVTHVKWKFAERLAAGASGEVAFRGELR